MRRRAEGFDLRRGRVVTNVMKGDAMIEEIMFFGNGNYASFKDGAQNPKEQGNAFLKILQEKLERGVVAKDTKVSMEGWDVGAPWTVGELLKSGRLTDER